MVQDPQSTSHTSAWQLGPDPGWPAELDQVKQCNTPQQLKCTGVLYRSVMLLYSNCKVKLDLHVPSNNNTHQPHDWARFTRQNLHL